MRKKLIMTKTEKIVLLMAASLTLFSGVGWFVPSPEIRFNCRTTESRLTKNVVSGRHVSWEDLPLQSCTVIQPLPFWGAYKIRDYGLVWLLGAILTINIPAGLFYLVFRKRSKQ